MAFKYSCSNLVFFGEPIQASIRCLADFGCDTLELAGEPKQEWEWVVSGIREIVEHAASLNVKLIIEAWNHYGTYLLNTVPQPLDLMRAVDRPNVGVMCDVFHVDVGDKHIAGTVRTAGRDMLQIHFDGSSCPAPGTSNMDFLPVMQALKDTIYDGYITFELLPPAGGTFGAMERSGNRGFYDKYTEQSIDVIRGPESRLH